VLDLIDARHRSKIGTYVNNGVLHFRRTQAEPGGSKTGMLTQVFEPAGQVNDSQAWKPKPTGIPEAIKLLFPDPITIGAMGTPSKTAPRPKPEPPSSNSSLSSLHCRKPPRVRRFKPCSTRSANPSP